MDLSAHELWQVKTLKLGLTAKSDPKFLGPKLNKPPGLEVAIPLEHRQQGTCSFNVLQNTVFKVLAKYFSTLMAVAGIEYSFFRGRLELLSGEWESQHGDLQ